jgi:hypothetical protein
MSTRTRFIAALSAALLSGIACIATLIEPQWFELLFDESPDGGDGSLETIVAVAVSLVACVLFAWLARREWKRDRRDAGARARAATGKV